MSVRMYSSTVEHSASGRRSNKSELHPHYRGELHQVAAELDEEGGKRLSLNTIRCFQNAGDLRHIHFILPGITLRLLGDVLALLRHKEKRHELPDAFEKTFYCHKSMNLKCCTDANHSRVYETYLSETITQKVLNIKPMSPKNEWFWTYSR